MIGLAVLLLAHCCKFSAFYCYMFSVALQHALRRHLYMLPVFYDCMCVHSTTTRSQSSIYYYMIVSQTFTSVARHNARV